MEKSPEAFRTISEVAEWLDVPTHVLRFWESRFTQVKPVKRAGGRRYYRPSDIALLGGIKKLLHEDGLTIRGVQKVLREQGVKHVAAMGDAPDRAAPDSGAAVAAEAPGADKGRTDDAADLANAPPGAEDPADDTPDPDEVLLRFPFVDDDPAASPGRSENEVQDKEPTAGPPLEEAAPEGQAPKVPFIADVPDADPEDDSPDVTISGARPPIAVRGLAELLSDRQEELRAIHDRLVALRARMVAEPADTGDSSARE